MTLNIVKQQEAGSRSVRLKVVVSILVALCVIGGFALIEVMGDEVLTPREALIGCKLMEKNSSQISDCIREAGTYAIDNNMVKEYTEALKTVVVTDETLYPGCHPALHTIGQNIGQNNSNYIDMLDILATEPICDWGIGHGIFDGLAMRAYDRTVTDNLIQWCENSIKHPNIIGVCLDGIGHYIWSSTLNVEISAQTCAKTSVPVDCGGGVGMQMFASAGVESTWPRSKAGEMFNDICRRWKEVEDTLVDACAYGAGYIYGLDVQDAMWEILNANKVKSGPLADISPSQYSELEKVVNNALDNCGSLSYGQQTCIDKLSTMGEHLFAVTYYSAYTDLCQEYKLRQNNMSCLGVAQTDKN